VAGDGADASFTVEATQNFWLELVHPLKRDGRSVYLVSPAKSTDLRRFYHKHTKTDAIDAEAISRLPVVDPKLHKAVVSPPAFDTLRRLARQSWQLRERMSARKRRIMSRVLMVYPGFEKVFRNRYCGAALLFYRRYLDPAKARRLGRRRLGALLRKRAWGKFDAAREQQLWEVIENAPDLALDYTDMQFLVNQDLDLLEAEERSQQAIRERMAEIYSEVDPECRLLTVPGIGDFLAATITSFVGEPGRFQSGNEAVSHAGLCPRKKSSGGTETANQRLTHHGDPTLRSCLYVAAEIARQYDPELQAFYRRLRARGKHHKLVICALAAKLLRRCFAVLHGDTPYQVRHQGELQRRQNEEGKAVRESVSEVAELLNDSGEPASPTPEAYAPQAREATYPRSQRSTPQRPRLRRKKVSMSC
jgi:transposase